MATYPIFELKDNYFLKKSKRSRICGLYVSENLAIIRHQGLTLLTSHMTHADKHPEGGPTSVLIHKLTHNLKVPYPIDPNIGVKENRGPIN